MTLGALAAMLFNGFLAVFYLLMINYNWREDRLHRLQVWVQVIVWISSLALVTFPLFMDGYHNSLHFCAIASYPQNCTETWMLEASPESYDLTETDCTAGDNAGSYRRMFTLVLSCSTMLCSFLIFCLIYCRIRSLDKHDSTVAEDLPSTRSNKSHTAHTLTQTEDHDEDVEGGGGSRSNLSLFQCERDVDQEGAEVQDEHSLARSRHTTSSSRVSSQLGRGKRVVAREGMFYIAAFFLVYGPYYVSLSVYYGSGEWNVPLDRAAMVFASLQGFYNMCIFCARRTQMKTAIGRHARKLIRFAPCLSAFAACVDCARQQLGSHDHDDGNSHQLACSPTGSEANAKEQQQQQQQPPAVKSGEAGDILVQWKEGPRHSVSELGLSGASYIGLQQFDKWQSASLEPFHNPLHYNLQQQQPPSESRRQDATPSRPIRTSTAASGLESIDEMSELTEPTLDSGPAYPFWRRKPDQRPADNATNADSLPHRPMRVESDIETVSEEDSCYEESADESHGDESEEEQAMPDTSDAPPSQPRRVQSEVELVPPEGSSSDAPPSRPKRVQSEVEIIPNDSSSWDAPPSRPKRVHSEVEISPYDHSSCDDAPPSRPCRVQSEVETFPDDSNSDGPPSRPCRMESDAEEISHKDSRLVADSLPSQPFRVQSEVEVTPQPNRQRLCERVIANMPEHSSTWPSLGAAKGSSVDTVPCQPNRTASSMGDSTCDDSSSSDDEIAYTV